MNDGYQIVEPPCLAPIFSDPRCFDLAVLILHWIAFEANARKLVGDGKVEVIRVEYAGAYPALGICGYDAESTESVLNQFSVELLETKVAGLIQFALESDIHWRNHASALLGP